MIRFHKEGYKIIVITFILAIVAILAAEKLIELNWVTKAIQVLIIVLLITVLQFFRNPKRLTSLNDDTIIAPVDGKVVVIEEVEEPEEEATEEPAEEAAEEVEEPAEEKPKKKGKKK